jgi:aspartyl-tRNA(Asn)/glutamyl-tRNA(Gln) amidotransferase subunit A
MPGAIAFPESLAALSAAALRRGYAAGDFSPVEAIDALAQRAGEVDGAVNAFAAAAFDAARREAVALPREWVRDVERRPLAGVPVAVKDVIDVAGMPTRCGSALVGGALATADAPVVRRLREAGALISGKTNLHEFACGITAENPHQGRTLNPAAPDFDAGGSSSGSAAAVAAYESPLALGTDTGGSVRIPAAHCAIAGLKPTYGAIPTVGVWPMARSLDHVGPLARTPEDLELIAGVLLPGRNTPLRRVGVHAFVGDLAPEPAVAHCLDRAARALEAAGCAVVPIELPEPDRLLETYDTISTAEMLSWHASRGLFPAHADEYGEDVRARLRAGEGISLADYAAAVAARAELVARLHRAVRDVDVVLSPVGAVAPPRAGEGPRRRQVLAYTVWQSLAGWPSCAVSMTRDSDGAPIAVQLTGRPWTDADVLDLARAMARAREGQDGPPGPQLKGVPHGWAA